MTTKPFFAHANAIIETSRIGNNTRIWAFAHVLPGAVIGEDCNLCDHTFVENDVVIGDRVTVKSGVQLWDGITVEDDVFIGPNATFTNDPFPRSKQRPGTFSRTVIRQGASIGANATILPGLTIGRSAMVGAGAVVAADVPAYSIVTGNPARISGYVESHLASRVGRLPTSQGMLPGTDPQIKGVTLHDLPVVTDLRGSLSFAQYDDALPFVPRRYFLVYDVPGKEVQGERAQRSCHQFLVCVSGSCSIVVDDGLHRAEVLLDRPNLGIHIPPLIWAIQYKFSPNAVLLVLASDIYRAEDYIRDYEEFVHLVKQT